MAACCVERRALRVFFMGGVCILYRDGCLLRREACLFLLVLYFIAQSKTQFIHSTHLPSIIILEGGNIRIIYMYSSILWKLKRESSVNEKNITNFFLSFPFIHHCILFYYVFFFNSLSILSSYDLRTNKNLSNMATNGGNDAFLQGKKNNFIHSICLLLISYFFFLFFFLPLNRMR